MQGKHDYWFPAKRYGWGWGVPVRWQGWATLCGFLASIAIAGFILMPRRPVTFLLFVLAASALLTFICYLTGEPPRWRWGDKPESRG